MIKLEKIERYIIVVLTAALILGIVLTVFVKTRPLVNITIQKFDHKDYKKVVEFSPEQKININYAGEEELVKVKGIGKKTARRIVEYRQEKGLFSSIDDLKNVKGVGAALFEKIKSRITAE